MIEAIRWDGKSLILLDQTKLPGEEVYVVCDSCDKAIDAIKTMIVRGAPAIGIVGAFALALAAHEMEEKDWKKNLNLATKKIIESRPTAIHLQWAIEYALKEIEGVPSLWTVQQILPRVARIILNEDIITNKTIGENGAVLLPNNFNVMTICNTGSLATGGHGTALGIIRSAAERRAGHVFVCETRPRMQGSKLTAWELKKDNIPFTLISDNMASHVMKNYKIDAVIAGADRIAANGDTANKIGTSMLAILAQHYGVPFYIAAPTATFDLKIFTGDQIPIENRSDEELTMMNGISIAPEKIKVLNPSFDITPSELITGIVTEKGIIRTPYESAIRKLIS